MIQFNAKGEWFYNGKNAKSLTQIDALKMRFEMFVHLSKVEHELKEFKKKVKRHRNKKPVKEDKAKIANVEAQIKDTLVKLNRIDPEHYPLP